MSDVKQVYVVTKGGTRHRAYLDTEKQLLFTVESDNIDDAVEAQIWLGVPVAVNAMKFEVIDKTGEIIAEEQYKSIADCERCLGLTRHQG